MTLVDDDGYRNLISYPAFRHCNQTFLSSDTHDVPNQYSYVSLISLTFSCNIMHITGSDPRMNISIKNSRLILHHSLNIQNITDIPNWITRRTLSLIWYWLQWWPIIVVESPGLSHFKAQDTMTSKPRTRWRGSSLFDSVFKYSAMKIKTSIPIWLPNHFRSWWLLKATDYRFNHNYNQPKITVAVKLFE